MASTTLLWHRSLRSAKERALQAFVLFPFATASVMAKHYEHAELSKYVVVLGIAFAFLPRHARERRALIESRRATQFLVPFRGVLSATSEWLSVKAHNADPGRAMMLTSASSKLAISGFVHSAAAFKKVSNAA